MIMNGENDTVSNRSVSHSVYAYDVMEILRVDKEPWNLEFNILEYAVAGHTP